ncbi:enoyl-CoA hydratase-related protein [Ureibacillus sp. NPDC094379]
MALVKLDKKEHITYITLNRPDVLNAFNYELLIELQTIIETIHLDSSVRVVVITGAGDKAFSVGADLKERKTLPDEYVFRNLNKFNEVFSSIEQLPQPTICALNGYAFGGGLELALACDFRFAADHITIGLTETSLGIIPGAGGTQRLPRIIGETKALELILTAKRLSAFEAMQYGLLTKIAPAEQLLEEINLFAESILQNAPIAIKQAKFAVKQGLKVDVQTGLQIERKAYELTIPTEDRIEALQAFAEKRKPNFKGK